MSTEDVSDDIFCDGGNGASVIIRYDPVTNRTTVVRERFPSTYEATNNQTDNQLVTL